jgi:hypothetical protein
MNLFLIEIFIYHLTLFNTTIETFLWSIRLSTTYNKVEPQINVP